MSVNYSAMRERQERQAIQDTQRVEHIKDTADSVTVDDEENIFQDISWNQHPETISGEASTAYHTKYDEPKSQGEYETLISKIKSKFDLI